jgi:hypothetical protein
VRIIQLGGCAGDPAGSYWSPWATLRFVYHEAAGAQLFDLVRQEASDCDGKNPRAGAVGSDLSTSGCSAGWQSPGGRWSSTWLPG